jgi:hypothetical protein
VRNYFKAAGHLFFFSEYDEDDIARAFAAASLCSHTVAVFRPTLERGPWDVCQVVGHRPYNEIVLDVANTNDAPTVDMLLVELQSLPSSTLIPMDA